MRTKKKPRDFNDATVVTLRTESAVRLQQRLTEEATLQAELSAEKSTEEKSLITENSQSQQYIDHPKVEEITQIPLQPTPNKISSSEPKIKRSVPVESHIQPVNAEIPVMAERTNSSEVQVHEVVTLRKEKTVANIPKTSDVSNAEVHPITDQLILAPIPEIIMTNITETIEISEKQIEQTELLVINLPEDIQTALAKYIESAEPEQVEVVEQLVVTIAVVADRLHELVMAGQENSEEAQQIEASLSTWYEQLLTQIEVEHDQKTIAQFIESVRAETYKLDKEEQSEILDEGTHEHKPDIFSLPQTLSHVGQGLLNHNLGKFVVELAAT